MNRLLSPIHGAGVLLVGLLLTAGCGSTLTPAERAAMSDPDIVAVFAGQTLSLDAFEEEYARSVGEREAARNDSLSAYQDFLERFVNFRLKVIEGDSAGYFEDAALVGEINSYRTSFAKPYLLDRTVINPIIEDLYEKRKEMIDVSHILIRVSPDASPADTLAAYGRISALRDSVQQGLDFGDVAARYSEDPSAQRPDGQVGARGRLGFFTAGNLVLSFEDMAYATPVGEVSPAFRTRFGYHLLLIHDRIPAVPAIRVSHLMIRPDGPTPEDSTRALEEIRGLKQRIEQGASFNEMAGTHSDDRVSAAKGGDLGFLRFDNYQVDRTFREAAFALDALQQVSDVVQTPFGFHLIMITERRALGTLEEEYEQLKNVVSKLPRTAEAEKELAAEVRARYGARIDSAAVFEIFDPVGYDSLMIKLGGAMFTDADLHRIIGSIGDSTFTLRDLASFTTRNQVPKARDKAGQLDRVLEAFFDDAALAYEATALETRDAEFGRIMQEFRDGLVLFRLMEDSVWTVAQQDSAGLRAYYQAHRDAYRFPARTRIIEVSSPSDSLLQAYVARVEGGLTLDALAREVSRDTTVNVSVDTVLVEGQTDSIYDRALALQPGQHTEILPYRVGRVVLFRADVVPPGPKAFDQARPEVVNDYQEVLEDRLVARLRDKYNARTYPERLAQAFAGEPSAEAAGTASSSQ